MGKNVYSGQSRRLVSHSCHAIGAARGSSLPAFSRLFSTCFERLGFVRPADSSGALGQERSATDASLRPVGRIEEDHAKYRRERSICGLLEPASGRHFGAIRPADGQSKYSRATLHFSSLRPARRHGRGGKSRGGLGECGFDNERRKFFEECFDRGAWHTEAALDFLI